jgi:hypothetical protein
MLCTYDPRTRNKWSIENKRQGVNRAMSDEQTIYIGPQDDLTSVRERLERIPARRVTLVIPSQTLLRNLIAWRNLYDRAQKLGKEVLIISSDPQIRSVAQAAKFKVASLESGPPGNRPRPSGRISRPSPGGRGPSTRPPPGRIPPKGPGEQPDNGSSPFRQSGQPPLREPRSAEPRPQSRIVPAEEPVADDLSDTQIPPMAPFEQGYSQPYDFRFDPSSPISPLSREQIEEEPNMLFDDVQTSQNIIKAASEGSKGEAPADTPQTFSVPAEQQPSTQEPFEPYKVIPLSGESDPFADMSDSEPPLAGEQRGSVSIDGFDTTEQHIQDIPDFQDMPDFTTEKIQSDYDDEVHEGNHDPVVVDADPPGRTWMDMLAESEQEDEGTANPPQTYSVRPRNGLVGNMQPQQRDSERSSMPFIEDEPTEIIPPDPPAEPVPPPIRARASASSPVPAGPPSSSRGRGSQSSPTRSNQPVPPRAQNKQETPRSGGTKPSSALGVAGGVGKQTGAKETASRRRRSNSVVVVVAIIIAVLLLIGTLAFAVPSATVTVTLAAKEYTSPVKLIAKPRQAVVPGFAPAESLTHDFSVSVTANATGSKAGPGAPTATGTVTFTNTGKVGLDIPTGTVVATANGIQFTTTEDVFVVPPGSSVPPTMSITVQGSINADAGTVTVIPLDSKSAIAKHNGVSVTDVQLQITNPSAITGGGSKQVTAVQQADLDAAKAKARSQEQSAIDTWVKQNTHTGDVAGTPIVTASTVVNSPPVNAEEDGGSFLVTVKLTVAMLIVRNANLQAATVATLNDALKKDKAYNGTYVVLSDSKQPLTIGRPTVKGDDQSLLLSFTPTATIVPNISKEQVQHLLVGKWKAEAPSALLALNPPKTTYVHAASVEIWPSFINWMPLLGSRIDVNFVAG